MSTGKICRLGDLTGISIQQKTPDLNKCPNLREKGVDIRIRFGIFNCNMLTNLVLAGHTDCRIIREKLLNTIHQEIDSKLNELRDFALNLGIGKEKFDKQNALGITSGEYETIKSAFDEIFMNKGNEIEMIIKISLLTGILVDTQKKGNNEESLISFIDHLRKLLKFISDQKFRLYNGGTCPVI